MRLSLRARLLLASAAFAIVVAAAVLALTAGTAALDDATRQRTEARLTLIAAGQVEKDVLDMEIGVRGFTITSEERFLAPWRTAQRRLPADLRALRLRARDTAQAQALVQSLATASTDYVRAYARPTIAAARTGRRDADSAMTAAGKLQVDRIRAIVGGLTAELNGEVSRLSRRADDAAHNASRLGIATLAGSLLLIILFTTYLLRGIIAPIRRVAGAADDLAAGDLTARAPEGGVIELDRLGASFNRMAATIAEHRAVMDARNVQLAAAKQDADRANDTKSRFLSRMSHELRTPLNAILGFAQLLELDEFKGDHREATNQIIRAGRHLLQLIDEVLDIARVEAGELRMSPEPVDAAELLDETLALVAPLAKQRSIRLIRDLGHCADVHVMADRQRLKQILLNLLSNAIKYNREAGEVRIFCRLDDGERLEISVCDTGAGLSPGQLTKLFEPFERLGVEQTGIEGTGLGLALSRRLAAAMGADVTVTSTPGEGSTFCVQIATTSPQDPAPEHDRPAAVQILGEPRVLYIEDNLSNLKLIEHVLSHHAPMTFLPAMQGSIGLELAREHRPDIILLDLHLPDLPGDQVLIRLKAEPATRDTPVILLSADASPGQIQRLLDAGAADYLTKPIDVQQLLNVIGHHLRPPAAEHGAPAKTTKAEPFG